MKYLQLMKPKIIMGNWITATAGFCLGGHFNWLVFAMMLLGLGAVIGAGCVSNNYIDREIDAKMARTKTRALVQKTISPTQALWFALALLAFGILLLTFFTNLTATLLALFGFLIYVGPYSLLKPKTTHATVIGSLAGAMPPIVGYAAAVGHLDQTALILFSLLILWQMPHFYALSILKIDDYAAASIPVLPLQKGLKATKVQMNLYCLGFAAMTFFPIGSTTYRIVAPIIAACWIYLAFKGFQTLDDKAWAKEMFRFSLLAITALSIAVCI